VGQKAIAEKFVCSSCKKETDDRYDGPNEEGLCKDCFKKVPESPKNKASRAGSTKLDKVENKELLEKEAYRLLGAGQMAHMFKKFSDITFWRLLKQIHDSKIYRHLKNPATAGFFVWEDFCKEIGINPDTVREQFQNMYVFGSQNFPAVAGKLGLKRDFIRELREAPDEVKDEVRSLVEKTEGASTEELQILIDRLVQITDKYKAKLAEELKIKKGFVRLLDEQKQEIREKNEQLLAEKDKTKADIKREIIAARDLLDQGIACLTRLDEEKIAKHEELAAEVGSVIDYLDRAVRNLQQGKFNEILFTSSI